MSDKNHQIHNQPHNQPPTNVIGPLDTDPNNIPELERMDYLELAQDLVRYMLHTGAVPIAVGDDYSEGHCYGD
jgi:hypothetical protein